MDKTNACKWLDNVGLFFLKHESVPLKNSSLDLKPAINLKPK